MAQYINRPPSTLARDYLSLLHQTRPSLMVTLLLSSASDFFVPPCSPPRSVNPPHSHLASTICMKRLLKYFKSPFFEKKICTTDHHLFYLIINTNDGWPFLDSLFELWEGLAFSTVAFTKFSTNPHLENDEDTISGDALPKNRELEVLEAYVASKNWGRTFCVELFKIFAIFNAWTKIFPFTSHESAA